MKREGCFAVICYTNDNIRHRPIKSGVLDFIFCAVGGNIPRKVPRIPDNIFSVIGAYRSSVLTFNLCVEIIDIGIVKPRICYSGIDRCHIALSSCNIKRHTAVFDSIIITLRIVVSFIVVYEICIEYAV